MRLPPVRLRAIAQEAQLLLLDEPFNGLDTTTSDLLLEVLAQLRADGVAVVMSTHDLAVAHLACDHACLSRKDLPQSPRSSKRSRRGIFASRC